VIVWVIGQMYNGKAIKYTPADGNTVLVAPLEHTMILTGYNPRYVWVVDAGTGQAQVYPLATFLASWRVLGNLTILSRDEDPTPTPTPTFTSTFTPTPTQTPTPTLTPTITPTPTPTLTPTPPRSVIVRSGDTLLGLANRFQVAWSAIVKENGMIVPYFIYPGEELKLPIGASIIRQPGAEKNRIFLPFTPG
jgi:LysM repeat protein